MMDPYEGMGRRGPSTPGVLFMSIIVSALVFVGLRMAESRGLLPFLAAPAEADVDVPQVTGLKPDQARAILGGRGLRLVLAAERPDPRVQAGLVAGQVPLPGSQVRPGSAIEAWVSAGVAAVTIPTLTGMRKEDAMKMLQDKGLELGPLMQAPNDTIEPGLVLGTDPPAGQAVAAGAKVSVVLSGGKAQKPVPKVVGMSPARAKKTLEAEGFTVGTVRKGYSENTDAEIVLKQEPAEATPAAIGSAVNLVVNETD